MKILIISLLLTTYNLFSQTPTFFKIDSIPENGLLLDKGWKWHAGDNPDFAKADFDDSAWEGINPSLPIPELNGIEQQSSIWLRIKIANSSSKIYASSIFQSVASEIYLNGHLIKSYGKIDKSGNKYLAFNPLNDYLLLKLDSAKNTLAIRIFFQKGLKYKRFTNIVFPLFSIELFEENNILKQINTRAFIWEGFNIGFPFILFLVYFTIFLFYIPNKSALWFSLWGLFNSTSSFLNILIKITPEIYLQNEYTYLSLLVSSFANISLIYSIYLLLHQKRPIYLILFISITILSTIYFFLGSGTAQRITEFSVLLSYVIIVIMMGRNAIKQGNIGGKYVILGILFFILFWAIFLFGFAAGGGNSIVSDIIFHLAMLSLPVTVATLLGLQFRNTNKGLLKNLEDIKNLSTEKQQILSTQNETLEKQVNERTAELRASQAQLIQSEKLASLGELTAGIAHEIQNPLNFVNNFSEVSNELLAELKGPLTPEGGILAGQKIDMEIISDLESNLEKITLHGKRASSIVKGMLEHSRTSTGEKELIDINALADEYLRLAYHGLRAKDKNFNADFKADLDPNLPKIAVIPQDIGRVLLNLINNAFYAVSMNNQLSKGSKPLESFTPLVSLTTQNIDNQIIIKIKDNGYGMSPEIKAKIFQPFFTTKPTGQGTGLGLSLAYDIVTKGHGGTIECESVEGVGTEFIVTLPIV